MPSSTAGTARWQQLYGNGYFDTDNNLRLDFVQRDFVMPLVVWMTHGKPPLSRSQVRRFFQHARLIERQLKQALRSGQSKWGELKGDVYKLDIAAADATSKEPSKIPEEFHDFISLNMRAIKTERDFLDGFMKHFEAVVGFGNIHFKKD